MLVRAHTIKNKITLLSLFRELCSSTKKNDFEQAENRNPKHGFYDILMK